MAHGSLAVDAAKNASLYIGDFQALARAPRSSRFRIS